MVHYLYNDKCAQLADVALASACAERSLLGHALAEAFVAAANGGVSPPRFVRTRYAPASVDELRRFHFDGYLSTLATATTTASEAALDAAGLCHDCPPFDDCLLYGRLVAGGALAGADALRVGACDVAVHWDGGRHHAQRDAASGFCYVNDVVLAVQRLRSATTKSSASREKQFQRVMVVDIDIHHCDAVADAFYSTDGVLVVSAHKRCAGFFPGTGDGGHTGAGRGAGHTLNLPLADGLTDDTFVPLLLKLVTAAADIYDPECCVLVCGADGLAGDPLGGWCLTPGGLARCALACASLRPSGCPLLVLGGGGYDAANTARAWAVVTAALTMGVVPRDGDNGDADDATLAKQLMAMHVPDHEHLLRYGPTFSMWDATQAAHLVPDGNNAAQLNDDVSKLLAVLADQYEEEDSPDDNDIQ